jgi:hypothetical protein
MENTLIQNGDCEIFLNEVKGEDEVMKEIQ